VEQKARPRNVTLSSGAWLDAVTAFCIENSPEESFHTAWGHPAWGLAISNVERIDTHLTVLFSFRR